MKNQNDLIVIIIAAVLAIGAFIGFMMTAPKRPTPPKPTAVVTSEAQMPAGSVIMAESLPGGGGGAAGGGGGGGRGGLSGGGGGSSTPASSAPGGGGGNKPLSLSNSATPGG